MILSLKKVKRCLRNPVSFVTVSPVYFASTQRINVIEAFVISRRNQTFLNDLLSVKLKINQVRFSEFHQKKTFLVTNIFNKNMLKYLKKIDNFYCSVLLHEAMKRTIF